MIIIGQIDIISFSGTAMAVDIWLLYLAFPQNELNKMTVIGGGSLSLLGSLGRG